MTSSIPGLDDLDEPAALGLVTAHSDEQLRAYLTAFGAAPDEADDAILLLRLRRQQLARGWRDGWTTHRFHEERGRWPARDWPARLTKILECFFANDRTERNAS